MPFPWEQAVSAGIQLGTSAHAASQANKAQEKEAGRQFDIADKQLAAFFNSLYAYPSVTAEQLQQALAGYQQLEAFANQYGGVDYVASQWADEAPRYQQGLTLLQSRLAVPATTSPAAVAGSGNLPAAGEALAAGGNTSQLMLVAVALLAAFVILKR